MNSLAGVYNINDIVDGNASLGNAGRQNNLQKSGNAYWNIFGLKKLWIDCKIRYITSVERCQQYTSQKHNGTKCATVHTEWALILLLLQEAQDQTLDIVPPEEFANAEVEFYIGDLLNTLYKYKKVGNYYCVNLIFYLHNIIISTYLFSWQINPAP